MKTYRKNSRRNPWRNTRNNKKVPVEKILAAILVISIPLMVICLTSNLVLRMPDTYQYNLRATQSVKATGRVVKEAKVIQLFGDFMQGKTDDFVLMEEVSYEPENIFSKADERAMTRLRSALNLILAVGLFMAVLTAVSYFFLIRWRKKELHMQAYRRSLVAFAFFTVCHSLLKLVPPLRQATWGRVFGTEFPKHDVLIQLLEKSFALHITIFDIIFSTIFMAILGYATWQVAGRKKLFKRF